MASLLSWSNMPTIAFCYQRAPRVRRAHQRYEHRLVEGKTSEMVRNINRKLTLNLETT